MSLAGLEIDLAEAKIVTDHSYFRYKRFGIDDRELDPQPLNRLALVKWNCPSIVPIFEFDQTLQTRKRELGKLIGTMISNNSDRDIDAIERRRSIQAFVSVYLGIKTSPTNDKKIGHNISRFFAAINADESRQQATTKLLRSSERILD